MRFACAAITGGVVSTTATVVAHERLKVPDVTTTVTGVDPSANEPWNVRSCGWQSSGMVTA
mgnify:CR=1 FL=1